MNYKKVLNPLSKITLLILIVWIIYEIVKLFQGEGDITDVIGLICIIIFLYVIPTEFWNKKTSP